MKIEHLSRIIAWILVYQIRGIWPREMYQWACSPLNDTTNLLPDIRGLVGASETTRTDEAVANTAVATDPSDFVTPQSNYLYIYPLPSDVCQGEVVSLQFCYLLRSQLSEVNGAVSKFRFYHLQNNTSGTFTVNGIVNISSLPTADICTERETVSYCCDTLELDESNRFSLPAKDFAFGVMDLLGQHDLLRFRDNADVSSVGQYSFDASLNSVPQSVGASFTPPEGSFSTNASLSLFNFVIQCNHTMCATPTETDPATTPTTVTMCDTPGEADCSKTQTSTGSVSSMQATSQATTAAPGSASSNIVIASIAGTLSGIGSAILIMAVVICMVVVMYRRKTAQNNIEPHSNNEQNQPSQIDINPNGLSTLRSENNYDYIESPFSSPVQLSAMGLDVAHSADAEDAAIATRSNQVNENENIVYENITDASAARTMTVETRANGSSDNITISQNSAYGVSPGVSPSQDEEEEPYYY